ncbi:hypothetical protein KAFR_0A01980 [Kazachstania africana CBS 2517]|uniref:Formate/nitrite transporter n=1 Tax=Kazachstania africana (strain ATCC 22294 / BCRC 22015 / CBS 2517 / CECT 1963 / NBRC 1671 / NRRL Y-8276) TaxID=1071382 RepID=H2AMN6_KAZAF|nr:hypothetical protein KAFR_0A01980 [Kazachstania africana CBS 2517]CCF55636.1 hypothetical protein KAFR_0A01980 [Kazachstania africana CBS 2517]
MVDDSYYITPHEAALAVVATSMKKSRLKIDTLVVNSILGGILFSSGSLLYLAIHAENPQMAMNNPGILNFTGAWTFVIGLFYVIIMGCDLFNSNILYFSVGLLRNAVTIYDLLISWFFSWIGNIAGTLFVSYLFMHVSGISSSSDWINGSINIVNDKQSYTFMETFLKAIAGNFFVCLAVYLQLLSKPIHVKLIVMSLPIFTFVCCGFTHVVADMPMMFIGMLNGADLSVGKYIWKLLIPASIGNIIGGFAFSVILPYYLHLIVVERDRQRLSLPEYEARDEQPELNMDSRVVRVTTTNLDKNTTDLQDENNTSYDNKENFISDDEDSLTSIDSEENTGTNSSLNRFNRNEQPIPYRPTRTRTNDLELSKTHRNKSYHSIRSPPGVFPVIGMGEPLTKERTIENSTTMISNDHGLKKLFTTSNSNSIKNMELKEEVNYFNDGHYNVLNNKPGTRLEKAITKMLSHSTDKATLPITTQDTFPFNSPQNARTYSDINGDYGLDKMSYKVNFENALSKAGVPLNFAAMSDNIAGIDNLNAMDLSRKPTTPTQHQAYDSSNESDNDIKSQ